MNLFNNKPCKHQLISVSPPAAVSMKLWALVDDSENVLLSSQTLADLDLLHQTSVCLWFVCLSLKLLHWDSFPPLDWGTVSVSNIWEHLILFFVFQRKQSSISCPSEAVKPDWKLSIESCDAASASTPGWEMFHLQHRQHAAMRFMWLLVSEEDEVKDLKLRSRRGDGSWQTVKKEKMEN